MNQGAICLFTDTKKRRTDAYPVRRRQKACQTYVTHAACALKQRAQPCEGGNRAGWPSGSVAESVRTDTVGSKYVSTLNRNPLISFCNCSQLQRIFINALSLHTLPMWRFRYQQKGCVLQEVGRCESRTISVVTG